MHAHTAKEAANRWTGEVSHACMHTQPRRQLIGGQVRSHMHACTHSQGGS